MAQKIIMKVFLIIVGVFVLVAGVSASFWVNSYKEDSVLGQSEKIVNSVKINDFNVGGMTCEEAEKLLHSEFDKITNKKLAVNIGSKTYYASYGQLGYFVDIDKAVEQAYNFGRQGNFVKDFLAISGVNECDVSIDTFIKEDCIKEYINFLISENGVKAKNASVYKSNGGIVINPSQLGITVDKEESFQIIKDALNNKEGVVTLTVTKDIPKITTESLKSINTKLSAYTTNYNPNKKERSINLAVACKKSNNTIIMPGEIFSFNGVVGVRNEANGFKNAIVFENGQEVEGMGGGICQISSTMFNAVLLSGLQIVSRNNHSLKVHYVPMGRDAMVSYGSSDFKFSNNTNHPVVVFANASGGKVNVEIWGNLKDKKNCSVSQTKTGEYSASITRYEINADGSKKATYTAKSTYQKPKPKEENQ